MAGGGKVEARGTEGVKQFLCFTQVIEHNLRLPEQERLAGGSYSKSVTILNVHAQWKLWKLWLTPSDRR